MKHSAHLLAGVVAGAVLGSAAVAAAEPVVLSPSAMDEATAGARPDVLARLAAVRARVEQLRAKLGGKWHWTPTTTITSSNDGKSNNVKIVRSVSQVSVTRGD
ncbi:hypothetical protein [Caulobacter sp. 17J80-11]|uniref:hypothetical protein n=1 Tax=Caulobacter sp. 17J80-11 TaxID=2763502 RepID=UPI001653D25B|nr:hypothetical protein [Caulobacter sp. 17J80-11]MBC6980520.1 hypothetical protein [Caulobacter sp. 17J80-11]